MFYAIMCAIFFFGSDAILFFWGSNRKLISKAVRGTPKENEINIFLREKNYTNDMLYDLKGVKWIERTKMVCITSWWKIRQWFWLKRKNGKEITDARIEVRFYRTKMGICVNILKRAREIGRKGIHISSSSNSICLTEYSSDVTYA